MLKILCQEETYVYNAYHMGKAFYPSEPVEASVEEKASHYVVLYLPSGKTLALDEESGAKEERSIASGGWTGSSIGRWQERPGEVLPGGS